MLVNPPKGFRGEMGNGRESGCKNRKHRRKNIDTADRCRQRPVRRQSGSGEEARNVGGLQRGSRESAYPLTRSIRYFK